jgi:lysophospholipase L1-like esterase
MNKFRRIPFAQLLSPLAVALVLVLAFVAASSMAGAAPRDGSAGSAAERWTPDRHWVHTWTAMPQLTEPHNMPPEPFTGTDSVLVDTTLRQTVRVSTGGKHLRLRFSNAFGDTPLPLTAVTVALPLDGRAGVDAVEPGSVRQVTFNGRTSVTVPTGAQIVSDELDFALPSGSNLTVTAYLAEGQASLNLTSHPGSRTTSHLLAGDHSQAEDLPGATPTDHWYLLSGVEVRSRAGTATAILGDSLTDGRGSTTNGNNRWPDLLADRLHGDPRTRHIALLNQAAGGNRVLNDGLGPNVLARLDRDVLAHSGVNRLIVFEGVNDIGTAAATPGAQRALVAELTAAYEQIIVRAHAQDIRVYGATLPPFGGNAGYDDADGHREAARQAVNHWIRTSGRFDAVLDFDRAVRDPDQPSRLHPGLHDGDWLHLNPEGYQRLADAVPARLLR